jgi:hypothetical protein
MQRQKAHAAQVKSFCCEMGDQGWGRIPHIDNIVNIYAGLIICTCRCSALGMCELSVFAAISQPQCHNPCLPVEATASCSLGAAPAATAAAVGLSLLYASHVCALFSCA